VKINVFEEQVTAQDPFWSQLDPVWTHQRVPKGAVEAEDWAECCRGPVAPYIAL